MYCKNCRLGHTLDLGIDPITKWLCNGTSFRGNGKRIRAEKICKSNLRYQSRTNDYSSYIGLLENRYNN